MKTAAFTTHRHGSNNRFRAGWTYQRLAAGEQMLAEGRGLSPAFFNLLDAVPGTYSISFAELHRSFPRLHADDLELWLAELCRMGLIAPAAQASPAQHKPAPQETRPLANASRLAVSPVQAAAQAPVAPAVAAAKEAASVPAFSATDIMPTLPMMMQKRASAEPQAMFGGKALTIEPPIAAQPIVAPAPVSPVAIAAPAPVVAPAAAPAAVAATPAVAPAASRNIILAPREDDLKTRDHPAVAAWRNLSMDALYDQLLAICAELDAREQSPLAALAP